MSDQTQEIVEQVQAAAGENRKLNIVGGGSKAFYGREPQGEILNISGHTGIVNYEPTELVLTARAGTTLSEIETALAERGQMLPFEPPHFGDSATLGGCVATGLSGPARPYTGSVRDYVLGTRLVNGKGENLRFGGEVMKNVAGYDVSRLLTGSLGILGPLLDVSLKVLPIPVSSTTLVHECDTQTALQKIIDWSRGPLPITASAWVDQKLYVRMSGAEPAVRSAQAQVGGEVLAEADAFWSALKEQTHEYFAGTEPLNRISVPTTSKAALESGIWEWGGGQRWKRGAVSEADVKTTQQDGGHISRFRGGDRNGEVFAPLSPIVMALHSRLKASFDPQGIFNSGRLYAEL